MKHIDDSFALNDRSQTSVLSFPKEGYRHGYIQTPDGVVGVYCHDELGKGRQYTILNHSRGGRSYKRTIKRKFTPRGLSIMATRFVTDVINFDLK